MSFIDDVDRTTAREFAETNMIQAGTVERGSLGGFNPVTLKTGGMTDATTVYEGKMRVRLLSTGEVVELGGGEVVERDAIISIPITADLPNRDDLVTVTDGGPDPTLATRKFRVLGADGGGIFGDSRRMSCQSFLPSRQGGVQ